MNPNHTNTFKKLQGIILQSCGLNDTGLTVLSKLGFTTSPQQLLNTRTQLAIYDETQVKAMAKQKFTVIVLDNLDREVKKVLQHQTLPVFLSRDVPHEYLSLSDENKSLDEVMASFTPEFFSFESPCHVAEKEAFLQVVFNLFFLKK